eukprot:4290940-Pyramimonas_sp.AAC.1
MSHAAEIRISCSAHKPMVRTYADWYILPRTQAVVQEDFTAYSTTSGLVTSEASPRPYHVIGDALRFLHAFANPSSALGRLKDDDVHFKLVLPMEREKSTTKADVLRTLHLVPKRAHMRI